MAPADLPSEISASRGGIGRWPFLAVSAGVFVWHCVGRGPYTRALALLSHRATVSREPFFEGGDSWLSGPHRARRLATTGPAIALEAPAVTGPYMFA